MSSFSGNIREGLNFIRRRFSSNDLPSDSIDEAATTSTTTPTTTSSTTPTTTSSTTTPTITTSLATTSFTSTTTSTTVGQPQVVAKSPSPSTNSSTLSASSNATITPSSAAVVVTSSASAASFFPASSKGPFPSAPSSPSKGAKSSSEGYSFARNLFGRSSSKSSKRQSVLDPRRSKILLVIDDSDVVCSESVRSFDVYFWKCVTSSDLREKYFRGTKIGGVYDVRVEQAGFSNLDVTSSAEEGVRVEICTISEPSKSFKPDFLLVRQKVKDAHEDWSHVIVGFKHGGLPSLNDLNSVYNMADKSWVFAQLTEVNRKLGRDFFHLIPQTYSTSNKNISFKYDFPVVTRVGPAHGGIGLTKIENSSQFQDWTGFLRLSQSPSSIQPFIETKCDVRIQKIGSHYRAFSRTPITNNWKISPGQVMLEEFPVTERHKTLLEECSSAFGGIDVMCLQVLVAADDQEYVIGASDCTMPLIGESQEEDRKLISELMVEKMDRHLTSLRKHDATNDVQVTIEKNPPLKDSRSQDLSTSRDQVEDSEDTMRNLRKTFAGIFGDM